MSIEPLMDVEGNCRAWMCSECENLTLGKPVSCKICDADKRAKEAQDEWIAQTVLCPLCETYTVFGCDGCSYFGRVVPEHAQYLLETIQCPDCDEDDMTYCYTCNDSRRVRP